MEVLFQLLWPIAQLAAELLLQLSVEIIAEFIGYRIEKTAPRRPARPWLAAIGFGFWGAVIGVASLFLFPSLFITAPWLSILNLVITPVIAGLMMARIGAWRTKKQQKITRLDSFLFGFIFALAMALVRFVWGTLSLRFFSVLTIFLIDFAWGHSYNSPPKLA